MQRRLTAILAADVAGYTTLMEADEAGTLARLKSHRADVFDPAVAAHGGRLVKLMGDGALLEFASVKAAVDCALAIQQALPALGATSARIAYRIGINLGDVISDGDDIYGDGVNVAARLQAMAPVGGIAISATVHDHVANKVVARFEDLGEQVVKGLQRPVHAYLMYPGTYGPAAAAATGATGERPRLAICVLPFANMSGDAEQEYFSDGITEDIITDLSKVSSLWVAARNTSFMHKGRHVDVQNLGRQMGVSHVLEGSVRKAGQRLRITAQLVDTASGGHVWSERYDRDLDDIFALQDEISAAIVAALRLRLLPEEKAAIERRGTADAEAYKLYLMARHYAFAGNTGNRRHSEAIIRLCERAIELDPGYAGAWAMLANAQAQLRMLFEQSGDGGLAAAEQALALDPSLPEAHAARGNVLARLGRHDDASQAIEHALRLDPDSPEAHKAAARLCYVQRRFAEAIPHWERTIALVETDYHSAGMLVGAYQAVGDADGALRAARVAQRRIEPVVAGEPDNGSAISFLVTALVTLGEADRAKAWMERALVLDPHNLNMLYNFACSLVTTLGDVDKGLDYLERHLQHSGAEAVAWVDTDRDMDGVRNHPRFIAATAAARARLGVS